MMLDKLPAETAGQKAVLKKIQQALSLPRLYLYHLEGGTFLEVHGRGRETAEDTALLVSKSGMRQVLPSVSA